MKKILLSLLISANLFAGISYQDRMDTYPYDCSSDILVEVVKSYLDELENIELTIECIDVTIANEDLSDHAKIVLLNNKYQWLRIKYELYRVLRPLHDVIAWIDQLRFERFIIESERYFKEYDEYVTFMD